MKGKCFSQAVEKEQFNNINNSNTFYPRSLNKTSRSFWIDKNVLVFLQKRAIREGTSLSKEVRTALKNYVKELENGK